MVGVEFYCETRNYFLSVEKLKFLLSIKEKKYEEPSPTTVLLLVHIGGTELVKHIA